MADYANTTNYLEQSGMRLPYPKSRLGTLLAKQLDPSDPAPLNVYEMRNYIYFGFSDSKLRPQYWKVLLGYYSQNQFKSELFYRNSRRNYHSMLKNIDWESQEIKNLTNQIDADLKRSAHIGGADSGPFALSPDPIRRIMVLYSLQTPEIGYVQGMLSLITPIYHVLCHNEDLEEAKFAEEDSFYMFKSLLSELSPLFSSKCDSLPCGITSQVATVFEIIKERDPALYNAMVSKDLVESGVLMRWILLMFCSEFRLDSVVWLWDKILSDSYRFEILYYCCAAALVLMRDILINEKMEVCMSALQHLSVLDVEVMFDIADVMRREKNDIVDFIEKKIQEQS